MSGVDINWGMWKNGGDSLTDAIAGAQDRHFLQSQRAFQQQQQQSAIDADAAKAAALPAIRKQLDAGDYTGAQIAAQFSGNEPIGAFIGKLGADHRAALSDHADAVAGAANQLLPFAQKGDAAGLVGAWSGIRQALKQRGLSEDELNGVDLSPTGLQGYVQAATSLKDQIAAHDAEVARQDKVNAPYTLGPGETRYVGGQEVAHSAFKPQVEFVKNADGSTTPVTVDFNGGGGVSVGSGTGNTRPERNNNPGNVKALGGGQMWRGQTGVDDSGYAIFGDRASGERAADRNLQSYGRRGINTVSGIVSRWAPRGDRNNTDAYIASVSHALGVDPHAPLDLTDPQVRQTLLGKGIFPNEGPVGRQPNAPHGPTITAGATIGGGGSTQTAGAANPTVEFLAQSYVKSGKLPPLGMGKEAASLRQAVMARVAQLGVDPGQINLNAGALKANDKSLSNVQTQADTIHQAESTALANGQQFIDRSRELTGQTSSPFINGVVNTVKRHITGDPTITAMDAAHQTFATEYAKVVAGSPSGAGTLSDSARHEALSMISGDASMAQKQRAFQQLKVDMHNRVIAIDAQLATQRNRITAGTNNAGGGSGPVRVSSPQEAAQLPSGTRFITPDGRTLVKH